MSIAIKVENLSKQYRLGQIGTGTFAHDMNRWWHKVRGKEDPYLKIGEANDRTQKGSSDYVWALRDINFEVKQGEVLGIIGRNGAGKSTLLKILSKTTAPTMGSIKIQGRIASLLEVGTGFHPELSGRDNIFLNGAILGMTRREIKNKFDEIVDFSGVERYIDTPVKRYSSGMYVRLAFAVAAHLEPEILIVDEVLAVGDSEFQKKCLDKMKDVSVNDGRTVLFVSHNLQSMKALSDRGICLGNGKLDFSADINETIEYYINSQLKNKNGQVNPDTDIITLKKVWIGNNKKETSALEFGDPLIVKLNFKSKVPLDKPYFWLGIKNQFGSVFSANSLIDGLVTNHLEEEFTIQYTFPKLLLLPQEYTIVCGARSRDGHSFLMTSMEIGTFNIITSVQELGLNGPLAEQMAKDSAPTLREYEVSFNEGQPLKFEPKLLCFDKSL